MLEGWSWFEACLQKKVFEGNDTKFWGEKWLGNEHLEFGFHRLYNLSNQKTEFVKNMGSWIDGVWQWEFRWRRNLMGRELEWLAELLTELRAAHLVENKPDKWIWTLEGEGYFSVHSSYMFLQDQQLGEQDNELRQIWSAPAPSNVKAFSWRALLDRIQSKENLRKRQVLNQAEDLVCPFCSHDIETTSHILISCPISSQIWFGISRWRGILTVFPATPREHMMQFPSLGRSKAQRLGELTIWMATIWCIWLMRNSILFNGAALDVEQVVEKSQFKAWQWVRTKVNGFSYSWFEWKSNPALCIDAL